MPTQTDAPERAGIVIAADFTGGIVRDNAEVNRMVASMKPLGGAGLSEDIGSMIIAG